MIFSNLDISQFCAIAVANYHHNLLIQYQRDHKKTAHQYNSEGISSTS
jgi:hypothetical protein